MLNVFMFFGALALIGYIIYSISKYVKNNYALGILEDNKYVFKKNKFLKIFSPVLLFIQLTLVCVFMMTFFIIDDTLPLKLRITFFIIFILLLLMCLYICKSLLLKLNSRISIYTINLTIETIQHQYLSYWNLFNFNFKSEPLITVYDNINNLDFLSVSVFEKNEYYNKILDEKGKKIIFGNNDMYKCFIIINKNEENRNYIYLDDLGLDLFKSDIIEKVRVVFGEDKISVNGISKELDNI